MVRFNASIRTLVPAALLAVSSIAPAFAQQANNSDQGPVVFRVDVVSRTTKAINYHHRQGSTVVSIEGTSLAPKAKGEIKVDSKTGATKIDAYIDKMRPATEIGEGFLTYVLWAITPEGRPQNLGEFMIDGDDARLQAATELQSFGMIVTAEPYYAVTMPSDYVVAEAVVKTKGDRTTSGTIMPIETKYELVKRGGYLQYLPPADRVRLSEAKNIPLDLMEARQAMAVAKSAGAMRYAADTMQKAEVDLQNAEAFMKSSSDKKRVQTLARHVTQLAEDARLISVRKAEEEALQAERAAAERREAQLADDARRQAEQRRLAEQEAARESRAKMEAQQRALETERAALLQQQQASAALAEKERQLAMEAERNRVATANLEAERLKQQQLEADAARVRAENEAKQRAFEADMARQRAEAEARQRELEAAAAKARDEAQRADAERTRMRQELVRQFNMILATRESARGLIVNMSDVLFDTGKYTLRAGTREKLAKIAGIILAHPGLKLEVEGHTDNTGGMALNQRLSEQRADEVRKYLVAQGIDTNSITAQGFGYSRPVADNNTAAGRQQNRRVELVVSGSIIGNADTPSGAQ
jgi:outer membrane protein OmpA-like peptidoglycan-associated protein